MNKKSNNTASNYSFVGENHRQHLVTTSSPCRWFIFIEKRSMLVGRICINFVGKL